MELLLPVSSFIDEHISAKFTFQYGATTTLLIISDSCLFKKFTFQYGATTTFIKIEVFKKPFYLHSNMELLLLTV